jgi:hypothetical protein
VLPVHHLEKQLFKSSVVCIIESESGSSISSESSSDPVPDPDLGFDYQIMKTYTAGKYLHSLTFHASSKKLALSALIED